MNFRQKAQVVVGALALLMIILWLFTPGWGAGKILGIISSLCILASMVISYFAEEKIKKSK